MASPLSTSAVVQHMADALPTHPQGDDSSDIASSYEVIALLVHSYLSALSFRLCGFSEDVSIPECETLAPRLPSTWNSGFGSLSFVYKHKQSSMRFLIRVDRMGSKVEIRGLAIGDENIHRFERTVRDVVQQSGLPIRITMEGDKENRSDLAEKLSNAFVSEQAVADIINDLKVKIVQKLIPKLQIEGYQETIEAEETARAERRGQEAQSGHRPFRGGPQPNMPYPHPSPLPSSAHPRPGAPVGDFPPPGFEDEYEINRPLRGGPFMPGGQHPFNIGHDDLNPAGLGPHDPLRGSFIGGGLPRPGGSSGMHPTFDDPLFTGQGGSGSGSGREGYNPQAPPGARWDPLGPGTGPGAPFGGSHGRGFGGGDFI
ncbi:hypothetical protein QQS21_003751 [Conoideocrella luteorostrata]|uniref:Proteasome inhibitor PI31 subunit n=1 Tax=Conoideocrella luteorostrata TaxID=1105319 RepID=A0AAJ0CSL3_9HYPO|nr:hypothetical protein QQS21_003751 [Conoideocrella luteorostrata]